MNPFARWCPLFALVLGVVVGFAGSTPGRATTYEFIVYNFPGHQQDPEFLNCGWHNTCISDSDGDSLDWENFTNDDVYWRSLSGNGQDYSVAGTIQVENASSGTCNTTKAHLRDPLGTSRQRIKYLHTSPYSSGSYYNVNSSLSGSLTTAHVGDTVNNDCATSDPYFVGYSAHLHQGQDSSDWVKNTAYPTRSNCTEDHCASYGVWEQWQHKRVWYTTGY
jgi:hypothetical protein